MDALQRVLAAKKRELAAAKPPTAVKEKYLRRAEVEALRAEAEENKQQQQQGSPKKRRLESSSSSKASDGDRGEQGQEQLEEEDAAVAVLSLPWPEMKRRLRELGEPITLFGESARARGDRLRRAEHDAASRQEDELEGGHRIRNRFVGHGGTQKQQDDDDDDDAENADDADGFVDDANDADKRRAGGAASDAFANKRSKKTATTTQDEGGDGDGDDESDLDKLVYRFFKTMLQSWERDLADRPDHVKRTAQGKIATKTMKQCKDYIRPLFKLCKQRQVPPDILPNLVEIVRFCRQGEFVLANDAYIKLAIGNAAWPIGVTMVGIHERTGREKINSNKQAHVMNNEAQRKYLTSVKRLVSYAQSISSALPSKKVG